MSSSCYAVAAATALVFVLGAVGAGLCSLPGEETRNKETESSTHKTDTANRAPTGGDEKAEEAVKLYTNEDLERMFGPPLSTDPAASKEEKAAGERSEIETDALTRLFEEQASRKARDMEIAQAEREIAGAGAEIGRLEQLRLRSRNPFLPRPELTPEQQQEELKKARNTLDEARARLEKLRSSS